MLSLACEYACHVISVGGEWLHTAACERGAEHYCYMSIGSWKRREKRKNKKGNEEEREGAWYGKRRILTIPQVLVQLEKNVMQFKVFQGPRRGAHYDSLRLIMTHYDLSSATF